MHTSQGFPGAPALLCRRVQKNHLGFVWVNTSLVVRGHEARALLQHGTYTELHPFPEHAALPGSVCVIAAEHKVQGGLPAPATSRSGASALLWKEQW